MSYSSRIKAFREARKLTHQQFADAVDVTRGAVQQWEKGSTAPKRVNQPAVAKFMGISVSELMSETSSGLATVPKQSEHKPDQPLPGATAINVACNQPALSPDAARLARWLDEMPEGDQKNRAFAECLAVITSRIEKAEQIALLAQHPPGETLPERSPAAPVAHKKPLKTGTGRP